jgi:hypothetical protein
MTLYDPMRWYNPKLEDFEWREVPPTDEQALELLEECSPRSSAAGAETYRQWRELGASIRAALIRAGEAAVSAGGEREKENAADRGGAARGRARAASSSPWSSPSSPSVPTGAP